MEGLLKGLKQCFPLHALSHLPREAASTAPPHMAGDVSQASGAAASGL